MEAAMETELLPWKLCGSFHASTKFCESLGGKLQEPICLWRDRRREELRTGYLLFRSRAVKRKKSQHELLTNLDKPTTKDISKARRKQTISARVLSLCTEVFVLSTGTPLSGARGSFLAL